MSDTGRDPPDIRGEAIRRLRAKIADPDTPYDEWERATARLEQLGDAQESESRAGLEKVKMPDKRWLLVGSLIVAWGAYSWLRYHIASERLYECYARLGGPQEAICVREAMGVRDSIITWALGLPLGLLITAAALIWAIRQFRQ